MECDLVDVLCATRQADAIASGTSASPLSIAAAHSGPISAAVNSAASVPLPAADAASNAAPSAGDVISNVANGVVDAVTNPLGFGLDMIAGAWASAIKAAFGEMMTALGTWWIHTPTIGIGDGQTDTVKWVVSAMGYWVGFVLVISVLVAGMRVIWYARFEPLRDLLRSALVTVGANGVAVAAVAALTTGGDVLASWFVKSASEGHEELIGNAFLAQIQSPALLIIVALIGIIAGVIQVGVMMIRSIMLILLTGFLPVSAAATNLEWGKAWFQKNVSWLAAFLMYKPVAALIYGTSLRLMASAGAQQGVNRIALAIMGDLALVMCVLALPALIRFLTPQTVGGGGGGGMAMALAGMSAIGTGAIAVGRGVGAGAPVEAGAPGASGAPGTQGTTGNAGNAGNAGKAGTTGAAGAAGAAGKAGSTGAAGAGAGAGAAAAATGPVGAALTAAQGAAQVASAASDAISSQADDAQGAAPGGEPS